MICKHLHCIAAGMRDGAVPNGLVQASDWLPLAGRGGGIDYFDLIRVFGTNQSNPARAKKPGMEGVYT